MRWPKNNFRMNRHMPSLIIKATYVINIFLEGSGGGEWGNLLEIGKVGWGDRSTFTIFFENVAICRTTY